MQTQLLNTVAAASYVRAKFSIGCTPAYLCKLRSVGGGPRFRRLGRYVVYAVSDIEAFYRRRLSGPMSSTSQAKCRAKKVDIESDAFDLDDAVFFGEGLRDIDETAAPQHPEIDPGG
jgi:hypothetical protein